MIYVTAIRPSTATSYKGITHYRWLNSADGKAGTADPCRNGQAPG